MQFSSIRTNLKSGYKASDKAIICSLASLCRSLILRPDIACLYVILGLLFYFYAPGFKSTFKISTAYQQNWFVMKLHILWNFIPCHWKLSNKKVTNNAWTYISLKQISACTKCNIFTHLLLIVSYSSLLRINKTSSKEFDIAYARFLINKNEVTSCIYKHNWGQF